MYKYLMNWKGVAGVIVGMRTQAGSISDQQMGPQGMEPALLTVLLGVARPPAFLKKNTKKNASTHMLVPLG